ncbi:hypothetical protein MMYC01_204684 [Madurella mycetomatis]|uniref:DUF6594 domain-containing protein n=1 Tax=Madurella mycetomatis TaxID=100816 RepID=A0A175WA22_9PEZI|nr:hypothetical protein MMYC01_204684 [Madurella mycetomatis]
MEYPQDSYPRLATLMGKEKDIAIFRRFDDLNILCLLSLQAEIVQLEKEFRIDCVADVDKPMKSQLKSLKEWLRDSRGGSSFLTNFETETWHDDHVSSYLCLEPQSAKGDPFTKWMLNSVVQAYDRFLGRYIGSGQILDERTGDKSYSGDRVNRVSNIVAAIMASALPVVAIFALNRIPSTEGRIGATASFTITFAVLMGIFSSAKRSEIIAATAT